MTSMEERETCYSFILSRTPHETFIYFSSFFQTFKKNLSVVALRIVSSSSSAYLCPNCWDTDLPYGLHIRRTGHNPPCRPSADWWVLTTVNAAGTNGLTCLSKNGGARNNKFLVTHPMINLYERCLASAMARRAHWPLGYRDPPIIIIIIIFL
jgi:hypothetical protein